MHSSMLMPILISIAGYKVMEVFNMFLSTIDKKKEDGDMPKFDSLVRKLDEYS